MKVYYKNLILLFVVMLVFCYSTVIFAQQYYYQGPSGGLGGGEFNDTSRIPKNPILKHIELRYGDIVDGIKIFYRGGGSTDWHGGMGGRYVKWPETGFHHDEQKNDYEYLTKVKGQISFSNIIGGNLQIVTVIEFETNKRRFSDFSGINYEKVGGWTFHYEAPKGYMIVGFHGRSGDYLDRIGVIMKKVPNHWKKY